MTGHTLILLLRDASPPIADAPSSHFHARRGGVRAPPATSITHQRKRSNANRGEHANGQNDPKPVVVHRHLPVSTNAIGHRGDQPERNSSARRARSGAAAEKSGRRHKPRQPSVTVRNARNSKRFPGSTGLLNKRNHRIFCVDWSCFISPQGSHALWDGKIVRRPDRGSS